MDFTQTFQTNAKCNNINHVLSLYQSEPHRRRKVIAKKSVICNMLNQTLATAGELIYKLAQGCEICNAH